MPCVFCLYALLKVVSYYDLSVMSEMGFQIKIGLGGEWVVPVLFCILFNFAKPLRSVL